MRICQDPMPQNYPLMNKLLINYFSIIILYQIPSPNKAHHKLFTTNSHPNFSMFFRPQPSSSFVIEISYNHTRCLLFTSLEPDQIKFQVMEIICLMICQALNIGASNIQKYSTKLVDPKSAYPQVLSTLMTKQPVFFQNFESTSPSLYFHNRLVSSGSQDI